MPELIDRLPLIDKLDQGQKKALDANYFTSFYALVFFKAMLQEAPTVEVEPVRHGRWISCSERLPERETNVLVYIPVWKDNPIQVAHLMYDEITWELSDGEFNFGKRDVLYWMPLPESPDGGDDNGD